MTLPISTAAIGSPTTPVSRIFLIAAHGDEPEGSDADQDETKSPNVLRSRRNGQWQVSTDGAARRNRWRGGIARRGWPVRFQWPSTVPRRASDLVLCANGWSDVECDPELAVRALEETEGRIDGRAINRLVWSSGQKIIREYETPQQSSRLSPTGDRLALLESHSSKFPVETSQSTGARSRAWRMQVERGTTFHAVNMEEHLWLIILSINPWTAAARNGPPSSSFRTTSPV